MSGAELLRFSDQEGRAQLEDDEVRSLDLYDGVLFCADGRIRSSSGQVLRTGWREGNVSRSGKVTRYRTFRGKDVHRLICAAFWGLGAPGHQVRHLDNRSTNNSANNLAWGTPAQNTADSTRARRTNKLMRSIGQNASGFGSTETS